jgi:hypothetical protein
MDDGTQRDGHGLLASETLRDVHKLRADAFALMSGIDINAANHAAVQARRANDRTIDNSYVSRSCCQPCSAATFSGEKFSATEAMTCGG